MRIFNFLVKLLPVWWPARTLGQRGEALAVRVLKRKGYIIVARGQREKLGEIDIIAVDGRTVVFVEVKTRSGAAAGHPSEAVDTNKQQRLTRLAVSFLKRHNLLECRARFDVVAIVWPAANGAPRVEHIENAFEAVGFEGLFS